METIVDKMACNIDNPEVLAIRMDELLYALEESTKSATEASLARMYELAQKRKALLAQKSAIEEQKALMKAYRKTQDPSSGCFSFLRRKKSIATSSDVVEADLNAKLKALQPELDRAKVEYEPLSHALRIHLYKVSNRTLANGRSIVVTNAVRQNLHAPCESLSDLELLQLNPATNHTHAIFFHLDEAKSTLNKSRYVEPVYRWRPKVGPYEYPIPDWD